MITERYTVTFLGLTSKEHTAESIGNIWAISADKIYEESSIYVAGDVYAGYPVRMEDREPDEDVVFIVISTRSPIYTADKVKYWEAYKQVIEEARFRLGNPCIAITSESVEFFYFRKVETETEEQ
ncbi:MAG: hypothetical protein QM793_13370 [Muricomes sp.]